MPQRDLELTIRTDSDSDELLALLEWIGHDDALRGHVRPVTGETVDGQMSVGLYEALVVALGASGSVAALARSLTTWLTHRRSDIKLTITPSDGGRPAVEIDASRVDPEQLLRGLRDLIDPPSTGE